MRKYAGRLFIIKEVHSGEKGITIKRLCNDDHEDDGDDDDVMTKKSKPH